MQAASLSQLYIDELRDLYNAETQLVKSLQEMAKLASDNQLRQVFEAHLRLTEVQVSRLEQIFYELDEEPIGRRTLDVEVLLKEGLEAMHEGYEDDVLDAALIAEAQRIEHREIAGYGTVRSFAKLLGYDGHVSLLEETLREEKQGDEKLTEISRAVNARARQSGDETLGGKGSTRAA